MPITRLPPGNVVELHRSTQLSNISAVKCLDHEVRADYLYEVRNIPNDVIERYTAVASLVYLPLRPIHPTRRLDSPSCARRPCFVRDPSILTRPDLALVMWWTARGLWNTKGAHISVLLLVYFAGLRWKSMVQQSHESATEVPKNPPGLFEGRGVFKLSRVRSDWSVCFRTLTSPLGSRDPIRLDPTRVLT